MVCGVHPPLYLTPAEKENMYAAIISSFQSYVQVRFCSAFSSFPDSLQFEQGSQVHSFRIQDLGASVTEGKRLDSIDGYLYGYSHFSQRRDSASKRGYQQVDQHVQLLFPGLSLISIRVL